MITRKMFISYVKSEADAGLWTMKMENERVIKMQAYRKEFATRIINWGNNLYSNFNGTGYKFAKSENFVGFRYNVERSSVNYWVYYQWSMENAYENFGKWISNWG